VRALFAALRASPVTFTIYVIEAAFALSVSVPLGAELTRDGRALGGRALFRAAALEQGLTLLPALRVQGRSLALGALMLLALTPLLRMAWLSALATPLGMRRALARGTSLYGRALATSLALALFTLLALAPWLLFAYVADAVVDVGTHARLHDLLLLGALASALPLLFLAHVAHDLAYCFALQHPPLRALRLGVRAALSPRAFAVALLAASLGFLLGTAPLCLPASVSPVGALFNSALLQASCLAALGTRSLWLAYALTCTESYATSRDAA
jgi:hypothetical protein